MEPPSESAMPQPVPDWSDDTGITVTVHAPEAVRATLALPASTRATLEEGSAIRDDERNHWTGFGTFVVRIIQEES
jgi:hypothetical protein